MHFVFFVLCCGQVRCGCGSFMPSGVATLAKAQRGRRAGDHPRRKAAAWLPHSKTQYGRRADLSAVPGPAQAGDPPADRGPRHGGIPSNAEADATLDCNRRTKCGSHCILQQLTVP
jgi:hypothetical protein